MEAKRRKLGDETASANKETKPGERQSTKCVSEKDVGITEYVNHTSGGFTGLIKQRYSDFQVNEITLDKNVLHLKQIEEPQTSEATPKPTEEPKAQIEVTENEHTTQLAAKTSVEFVSQCFEMLNNSEAPKPRTEVIDDKQLRSEIHQLLREGFNGILESRTDENRIVVMKPTKRSRNRQSNSYNGRKSEYLHFTLYKENKDTMEAISTIAKFMHIPAKLITFAGTKDRRAVTTQRACWRRGNVQRLAGLNGAFKNGQIRLGDFSYEANTIKLGDLYGNQFGIVIRNVESQSLAQISESLTSLRDNGFINYFGLQRFGTFSTSSHATGKEILCENYQGAVDGILSPQDVTINDSMEAREVWAKTGDAAQALALMPRRCLAESAILMALKESPNPLNALLRIPYSLKTMYVHAYQSYIWNSAASERVRRSRNQVLVGDLVWGEVDERGLQQARMITDECEANQFSIFDVVLPMPGNDVVYPSNMVAFYEELMAKDGIDCHNMQRKIKEFSVFGSYRALMAKPLSLTWDIRQYIERDATILYTDKEALQHGTRLAPEQVLEEGSSENDSQQKTAVVLTMGLTTSQYATMALREAMKMETSRNGDIYFA